MNTGRGVVDRIIRRLGSIGNPKDRCGVLACIDQVMHGVPLKYGFREIGVRVKVGDRPGAPTIRMFQALVIDAYAPMRLLHDRDSATAPVTCGGTIDPIQSSSQAHPIPEFIREGICWRSPFAGPLNIEYQCSPNSVVTCIPSCAEVPYHIGVSHQCESTPLSGTVEPDILAA